ncbi:hypothetical protein CFP56_034043 [Quercus suber]|uniref:Uncharacterized protein n=1 Tax=Quercus suber TaxID=58331 RepID=A0AAW0JF94_QUESU
MAPKLLLRNPNNPSPLGAVVRRSFRSDAALEAIAKASEQKIPNVILYNYPSFSGAFSALFAHLFHSTLNLPSLILPFSSIHPLKPEDFDIHGVSKCYLLDLIGPKGFALKLAQRSSFEVIAFDHRKSVLAQIPCEEDCPRNLKFHGMVASLLDPKDRDHVEMVLKYIEDSDLRRWNLLDIRAFNIGIDQWRSKLNCITNPYMYEQGMVASLLDPKDRDRVEMVLKYIEDSDLHRWSLPDIRAFNIGIDQWRSKLNCITNPYMYEQLLELSSVDLISKGNAYISSRQNAADKFLNKVFKVRLGRGFYGECLGVRVDGNSNLSDEIGKQLGVKSAAAGLRPIGAVVYMQRNNLKMCLRSIDSATDTSEVAKAYGGGGSPSSSSFIIRMDEYNQWLSVNSS